MQSTGTPYLFSLHIVAIVTVHDTKIANETQLRTVANGASRMEYLFIC
jgi:hypothetical protein